MFAMIQFCLLSYTIHVYKRDRNRESVENLDVISLGMKSGRNLNKVVFDLGQEAIVGSTGREISTFLGCEKT